MMSALWQKADRSGVGKLWSQRVSQLEAARAANAVPCITGEPMQWYDIHDPASAELDQLAARYGFHALHIEDCRHRDQRAKIEEGEGYLFTVLKPVRVD